MSGTVYLLIPAVWVLLLYVNEKFNGILGSKIHDDSIHTHGIIFSPLLIVGEQFHIRFKLIFLKQTKSYCHTDPYIKLGLKLFRVFVQRSLSERLANQNDLQKILFVTENKCAYNMYSIILTLSMEKIVQFFPSYFLFACQVIQQGMLKFYYSLHSEKE